MEMKLVRKALAFGILAVLFLGLVPRPGVCQVSGKSVSVCAMACCHGHGKAVPCPQMKAAASPDLIQVSSLRMVPPTIMALSTLALQNFLAPFNETSELSREPQIPISLFYSSPQIGPAPPVLS